MTVVAVLKPAEEVKEQEGREVEPFNSAPATKLEMESKVIPAPSIYEEINKKPALVDVINYKDWEQLTDELDVDNIKGKVSDIDKFILSEIKDRKLEDTIDSYKDVLEELFQELNINKNVQKKDKIERVSIWIKLIEKQRALNKRKQDILSGRIK